MIQLFEKSFEFDYYLNLSVSLLHFHFQPPKNVESIIRCIFHVFIAKVFYMLHAEKKKNPDIGVIDIKYKSRDH